MADLPDFFTTVRWFSIYLDVYSQETDTDIVFGNALVELRTGEWRSWTTKPTALPLLPSVDFSIDGNQIIARLGATFLRKKLPIDCDRQGSALAVTVGVLPQGTGYAHKLTTHFRPRPQQMRLKRWSRLVGKKPGAKEHLDGFRFQLPGVAINRQVETTLTVPGAFFTNTFVAPETPYDGQGGIEIPGRALSTGIRNCTAFPKHDPP